MGLFRRKTVACAICNQEFKSITNSHVKTHGINLEEYFLLYGRANVDTSQCGYAYKNPSERYPDLLEHNCALKVDSEATGMCILHSSEEGKDHDLFLSSLIALIKVYENQKVACHLEGIIACDSVEFIGNAFKYPVHFTDAQFLGDLKFLTTFEAEADFRRCQFKGDVSFVHSTFEAYSKFSGSEFLKDVDFQDAIFKSGVSFWRVGFFSGASFHQTKFNDRVSFGNCVFPQKEHHVRFVNTRFEQPSKVRFTGVDFARTLFRWTDISEINFDRVAWPSIPKLFGGRRYIADEAVIDGSIKIKHVHHEKHHHEKHHHDQLD